jgi:cell division protein FtsL
MRVAVISAVLSEVATKQDVRDLRQEMNQLRTEINGLRREINDLRREMRSLTTWTITAILIVWGSTVLPVMMRLAGII